MRTVKTSVASALAALCWLLVAVGQAWAGKTGEGWIADANDRVVTAFGLGLVVFFTLLVTVMTLIQSKSEKRKR